MPSWRFFTRAPEKSLFDYFEDNAREIHISACLLVALFSKDGLSKDMAALINESEDRADNAVHGISNYLDRKHITPIDRGDAKRLAQVLDSVVDNIDEAANLYAFVYELEESKSYALDFANEILLIANDIVRLCELLRKAGANASRILEICKQIHDHESICDQIYSTASKELFRSDENFRIYRAWERIYESLEDAADSAEDCAKFAEQILHSYF